MPRRSALLLLCCLLPLACTPEPPPDTARLPAQGGWLLGDPDVWAINQAQWAFADPGRTLNRPEEAARAAAAVDYLAGHLSTSPRWASMNPLTKLEMLRAREEVRQALGIVPNAPSQLVVNSLLACAAGLADNNPAWALATLHNPAFALPPEQTLHILANMPFLRMTNIATMHAGSSSMGNFARD